MKTVEYIRQNYEITKSAEDHVKVRSLYIDCRDHAGTTLSDLKEAIQELKVPLDGINILGIKRKPEKAIDTSKAIACACGGRCTKNPKHYKAGRYECIDVMMDVFGKDEVLAFCKLNAFKYLWRANLKGGKEDIEKAYTYLGKYLSILEDGRAGE